MDYSTSLKENITNLTFRSDTNLFDLNQLFRSHESMLKKLGPDSIIVVDNFNSPEYKDPYLNTLLQYPCRILISTQCKYPDYKSLELRALPPKDLTTLMEYFLGDLKDYKNYSKRRVNEIIRIFGKNTFLAVLTAHLIKENMISLNRLYKEVKRNAGFSLPHIFKFTKDRKTSYDTYANHIKLIFSLVKFTPDEQEILAILSLLSNIGIGKNHLREALSYETFN